MCCCGAAAWSWFFFPPLPSIFLDGLALGLSDTGMLAKALWESIDGGLAWVTLALAEEPLPLFLPGLVASSRLKAANGFSIGSSFVDSLPELSPALELIWA